MSSWFLAVSATAVHDRVPRINIDDDSEIHAFAVLAPSPPARIADDGNASVRFVPRARNEAARSHTELGLTSG